jgi:hypothetical protein
MKKIIIGKYDLSKKEDLDKFLKEQRETWNWVLYGTNNEELIN